MITLPASVSPQVFTPRILDHGLWNKGILGGSFTRTNRKGNRFAVKVTLPPIYSDTVGAGVAQDIRSAITQGMQVNWEQGALETGSVGTPVVNDDDVTGTSIPLRGLTPLLTLPKGRFFSVTHDGKSYLHTLSADAQVGANGEVTVVIDPELRVYLSDGDACEFVSPVIQGVIQMPEWEWNLRLDKHLDLSFDLVERW